MPTGIGASIGGYAGDALPVVRALSQVVDRVITHPNVMNGAMLYWPSDRVLYVEGSALDAFAMGDVALQPVGHQRIGLVLDSAVEEPLRTRHLQAVDAVRATLGIDVAAWTLTDRPLDVAISTAPSGASWGTIANPASLLRAARKLVDEAGCTALALVARFPDDEDEEALAAYRQGAGVDAVGGAEALISRLVTQTLGVPCAHAPALAPIDVDADVSPRAAAEELGYTFLPCVLANLHRAPALVRTAPGAEAQVRAAGDAQDELIRASAVDAVIVPADACGGSAVLSLAAREEVVIVAVEDNSSCMQAPPELLRLCAGRGKATVVRVASYLEAIGVVAAHRAGVCAAALTSQGTQPFHELRLD